MIPINVGEVWEATDDNFSGWFNDQNQDYYYQSFIGRKFVINEVDNGRPLGIGITMDDGVKGRTFWYYLQRHAKLL